MAATNVEHGPPWSHHRVQLSEELSLHYLDASPPGGIDPKGTILLIHGFPQTSYQFRHVIGPLASNGYRVIAPDYRGAGDSSHPASGYDKKTIARDLHHLLYKIEIHYKVHIVGHDIGGMVAHSYATQYPSDTASVIWGECPLPGTSVYDAEKNSLEQWHFTFQAVPDLPEALVAGNERIYMKHFFDKLTHNRAAFSEPNLDFYAKQYSAPNAMGCAFNLYRAFEKDKEENLEHLKTKGKVTVKAMVLSGGESRHSEAAQEMAEEMYERITVGVVEGSGHYIAEEQPKRFVELVIDFIEPIISDVHEHA